jgi:hypothetical protein
LLDTVPNRQNDIIYRHNYRQEDFFKQKRKDTFFLVGDQGDKEAAGGGTEEHPKEILTNIFVLFPDLHASSDC